MIPELKGKLWVVHRLFKEPNTMVFKEEDVLIGCIGKHKVTKALEEIAEISLLSDIIVEPGETERDAKLRMIAKVFEEMELDLPDWLTNIPKFNKDLVKDYNIPYPVR